MLKIRLRRTGARKRPNYRVVVAEVSAPRDGEFIEIIGFYDPLTNPATFRIDGDKARRWISQGAQPTERVARLLAREGLIEPRRVSQPPRPAEPAAEPDLEPAVATGSGTAAAESDTADEEVVVGAGEAGAASLPTTEAGATTESEAEPASA